MLEEYWLETEEFLDALPDALFFLLRGNDRLTLSAAQGFGRLLPIEAPCRSGALAVEDRRQVNRRNALLRRKVDAAVTVKRAGCQFELRIGASADVYRSRHNVFQRQSVAVERE